MRPLTSLARGIGLRPELVAQLCDQPRRDDIDFVEIAPENWLGIGGRKRGQLDRIADLYPLVAHGLSLSIADPVRLDLDFLRNVRCFLDDYYIEIYSDHLSMSRDETGQLYDLLPIPRRPGNLDYIAGRISRVQDVTNRRLVLENISYYHRFADQMPEAEFLAALVDRSGCGILLDINNVYVNARNHRENATAFVTSLPSDAIAYYHVAGHLELENGTLLDTHGTPVADAVRDLGRTAWQVHGPRPLLLERDNFVPSLDELVAELASVQRDMTGEAWRDVAA